MNECKEYLNIAVMQENKPVTYNSLARSLSIHVNTAKQALYEFSKENQRTVHAVYCLTGRTTKDNQFRIQLVKASELEETKKMFKQITGIHVYSVTSFEPIDFSILYPACKDTAVLSLENRIQCGILKNKNVTAKALRTGPPPTNQKKSEASKPFSNATPAASTKATPFKTPTKTAAATTSGKRKGTLMFGPATTKKQAVETPIEKNKPAPKPNSMLNTKSNQVKNKGAGKNKLKESGTCRIGTTNIRFIEEIERKMAKTTIKPEDIFSDDEEEEEQEEEPKPEEEYPIMTEEDALMEDVEAPKVEATPPPEPAELAPPGKVKRQVLRKKTTKNARGLLVTEEVWEWETVDASEVPKPAVSTKPKPTVSKAPVKKGGKKAEPAQRNLFSFFQKK
ncbi:hypothetical protein INT47_012904 [Mucor saturninus]|uniref:DNA polymerase delta subunit 3 n=1 Tax=Mucor saturninus TaxID=64648 RepID=A0A8H7UUR8_9FUNG|nr:hypothetical protein INT47_012904 [Mucor saturninus]